MAYNPVTSSRRHVHRFTASHFDPDRFTRPLLSFFLITFTNGAGSVGKIVRTSYQQATTVGIEVRVTNEVPATEENALKDAAPPWTTMSVPNSRTTPTTPTNPHPQYLSPHVFQGRNSLCCTNDYTLRRRRPMTLRIGPRLSLPNKSTSAPTTTTEGEWPTLRIPLDRRLLRRSPHIGHTSTTINFFGLDWP
nr:PREDICTED: uncharacterized protein LOC100883026 isoform X2 [Megachile rotundata]